MDFGLIVKYELEKLTSIGRNQPFSTEGFPEGQVCHSLRMIKEVCVEDLQFVFQLDSEFDVYKVYYRYIRRTHETEYVRSDTFFVYEASCIAEDPVDIVREIEHYCYARVARNEAANPL